jgi:hypothetical protein
MQEGCCMSCGVPQSIAPELGGWRDEEATSCYWIRQPESADESTGPSRSARPFEAQDKLKPAAT